MTGVIDDVVRQLLGDLYGAQRRGQAERQAKRQAALDAAFDAVFTANRSALLEWRHAVQDGVLGFGTRAEVPTADGGQLAVDVHLFNGLKHGPRLRLGSPDSFVERAAAGDRRIAALASELGLVSSQG